MSAIPVTRVARTLVDLADVLMLPGLQRAINEAELLGLFDLAALDRTLARLPNRRGRGRLRQALRLYRPNTAFTRSGGERSFLRLCSEHGLPEPKANLSVAGHEVDLLWPDAGLIVEATGPPCTGPAWRFTRIAGATASSPLAAIWWCG